MSSQKSDLARDTRERVLSAALALLEDGAANVRMSDIARQAGISRQAVYLHFPSRAQLLIAATHHLDEMNRIDDQLAASRQAPDGQARLNAYIRDWSNYIPQIFGVARALAVMRDDDADAASAWDDRMGALREGCQAAVEALAAEQKLNRHLSTDEATDLLWSLLSLRQWETLTVECGWSQSRYIEVMQQLARSALLNHTDPR